MSRPGSLAVTIVGVVAALCLAVFFYGATGPYSAFPVLLILCLSSLVLTLHLWRGGHFWKPPGLMPLCCFLLLVLCQLLPLPPLVLGWLAPGLARLYGEGVWQAVPGLWLPLSCSPAATVRAVSWVVMGLLVYLLSAQLQGRDRWQRIVVRFLVAAGGVYAFIGLMQFVVPGKRVLWLLAEWPERTSHHFGTFVNGNHYAALMGMLLPLAVASFLIARPTVAYGSWRERLRDLLTSASLDSHLLYGLGAVLAYMSIFFSLSRGGIISASLAVLLLAVLLRRHGDPVRRGFLFPGLLLLAVLAVGAVGWEPIQARFDRTLTAEGEIADQRLEFWQDSLRMLADQPLLGSGLGTFLAAYAPYKTAETGGLLVDHAHNDYIELLTDVGLLGTLLWIAFLLTALRAAWAAFSRRRQRWRVLICLALFCGLAAIGMHSVTDFNLRIPAVWLVFCFLLGFLQAVSHTSSSRRGDIQASQGDVRWLFVGMAAVLVVVVSAAGSLYGASRLDLWSKRPLDQLSSGELEVAFRELGLAAGLNPLAPEYRLALANLAVGGGDYAAAEDWLEKALVLDPLNPHLLSRLAEFKAFGGDGELAARLHAAAVFVDPTGPRWRQGLGDWLLSQGRRTDGLLRWGEALAMEPYKSRDYLGLLQERQVTSEELVALLPEHQVVLGVFAREVEKGGDAALAEALYRRLREALKSAEEPIPWGYTALTDYYLRQQRDDEALLLITEGVERCQPNPHLYARMGQLYQRQGLTERARDAYGKALLLKPDLDWVRKRLEVLNKGVRR